MMGSSRALATLTLLWGLSVAFTSSISSMNPASTTPDRTLVLEGFADGEGTEVGKLEALKQREAELAEQLAAVRREKLDTLRSRPLSIGVVGFGRFGQFIAKTFTKYGRVVVTSRSDYTEIADSMGAKYVPLSDPGRFLEEDLDVIVVAVSIVSFKPTIEMLSQHIEAQRRTHPSTSKGPLIVDVLSVKEHARKVMLETLPPECDILCTHPMFGPDSGKNG